MNKYDSITAIKGIACLLVFTTHWIGAFGGFGVGIVDRNLDRGIMRLLGYGTMCVYVFFMLSGTLVSMKVLKGRPYSLLQEGVRRYIRLAVPIFALSALVILFERLGLLRNQEAVAYAPTTFLGNFYQTPTPLYKLFTSSLVATIFWGDASLYGPLWMIPYIFYGTFFSIILSEVIRRLHPRGQGLAYGAIGAAFLIVGGYFINFYFGNLMAFGLIKLENRKKREQADRRILLCLGILLEAVGLEIALKAFIMAYSGAFGSRIAVFNDPSFWLSVGGAIMSAGFILLWETLFEKRKFRLTRFIVWIGERSYSIFLVHWLIVCSFSCWFYLRFYTAGPKLSVALNFILTTGLILLASHVFYEVLEKRAVGILWKKARDLLTGKS